LKSERGRLRSGLRRHGLAPRPAPIRFLVRDQGLHFTEGNRVTIYDAGRDALGEMLRSIESARDRIHLETYILRGDGTGRRFLGALSEKAREGVAVRLLFDAFGSLGLDDAFLHPLREAGGDVVAFNPLRRLYPRWAPRRRDHRKILSVDGVVAFAGGLNIGDEYWGGDCAAPQGRSWRDTHVKLEGPAVRDLDVVFLESWFRADGPDLSWPELVGTAPPQRGEVRCAVVPDGPVYRRRRMRELVIAGLRAATRAACLASPYFAPGRRVLRALGEAGRRGVEVDLVLAGETDHPILRRAAHAFLPRLLPSGVRVHEYQASMMHAKVALFDDRWAIVGSSNLDRQSFEHSYEVNLVLEGGGVADRFRESFARDLSHSRRMDVEALAQRSLLDRLLDRMASWVLRII
jgi:cardiolipin synthase